MYIIPLNSVSAIPDGSSSSVRLQSSIPEYLVNLQTPSALPQITQLLSASRIWYHGIPNSVPIECATVMTNVGIEPSISVFHYVSFSVK